MKIKDIIVVEASLNPFKWGKGEKAPQNFATKGNYSQSEVNRFQQLLNMKSTAMGGNINLDQLRDIAKDFVMNNYPSAGKVADDVSSINDMKSANAYINKMFQTAMANRASSDALPNPQPQKQPKAATNANGTPNAAPAAPPQDQTQQKSSVIYQEPKVGGGPRKKADAQQAAPDAQKQALAKDVEVIQQEPIMLSFKGQQFALNDEGQWFHMNKPTVPVPQSISAFLDQQHNASLGIK